MLQQKCNYCESRDLKLENKSKFDIMEAPMVALKCATCGKFIKWCPKNERQFYLTLETSHKEYQELCRLEEYERWADKEITKLHKQLAESEKKYQDRKDFCTSQINSLLELINNLQEEIAELKGLENESAND